MNTKEFDMFVENVKDKDIGEMTGEELKKIEGLLCRLARRLHFPLINRSAALFIADILMGNIINILEKKNENEDIDYFKVSFELKWVLEEKNGSGVLSFHCHFYDMPKIASSFWSFSLAADEDENMNAFINSVYDHVSDIKKYVQSHDKLHFEYTLPERKNK